MREPPEQCIWCFSPATVFADVKTRRKVADGLERSHTFITACDSHVPEALGMLDRFILIGRPRDE